MTIQQIANFIDQKKWAFSIVQVKPVYKIMVKNASKKDVKTGVQYTGETIDYINDLIKEYNPDEIQILPLRLHGSSFRNEVAEAVNVTINKNNNNIKKDSNMNDNQQFSALAGLSGLGLNMSEIFTAKDKAEEVVTLKARVEKLEIENRTLENTNRDLGFDLKLEKSKVEKKNDFVELLKSPQGISLISAVASKFSPVPALGNAAPQSELKQDEKIQWLVSFLSEKETPEMIKDLMIYIAKAQQDENGTMIMKEIAELLTTYNIIQSNKTA